MNGHLSPVTEWLLFVLLSASAVLGSYRMLRTMSMVRAGVLLMFALCSLAWIFLLLSADLIASMQIMMYVGGMLVMIMFMVMMSRDPGGAMMGIAPPEQEDKTQEGSPKDDAKQQHTGMEHVSSNRDQQGRQQDDKAVQHGAMQGMDMDMSMTHEFTRPAAVIGAVISAVLLAVIFSVSWPSAAQMQPSNSALAIGKELLDRYMVAFEGAGLLILLGVAGAVVFGRGEE